MNSFESWIGQGNLIRGLQQSLAKGQLSHAYLFEGAAGMGKMKLAKLLAKTIQCEEKGIEPCNHCASCIQFDSNNHPDVKYISPKEKEKSIKIEMIRKEVEEDINKKPYLYEKKIYIMAHADTMTTQAQNALLKTLEEPPSYSIIILLADSMHSFLPTILSRCVTMRFRPLIPKEMEEYITRVQPEIQEAEKQLLLVFSEGNPGKVKQLLYSESWRELRKFSMDAIQALHSTDKEQVTLLYTDWEQVQADIGLVLDVLNMWYRDILMYQLIGNQAKILNQDYREQITIWARRENSQGLNRKIKAIEETKKNILYHNANYQLSIENLLLKLKG